MKAKTYTVELTTHSEEVVFQHYRESGPEDYPLPHGEKAWYDFMATEFSADTVDGWLELVRKEPENSRVIMRRVSETIFVPNP